jgi:hypothetical protein
MQRLEPAVGRSQSKRSCAIGLRNREAASRQALGLGRLRSSLPRKRIRAGAVGLADRTIFRYFLGP